jgi:hypothetical protein
MSYNPKCKLGISPALFYTPTKGMRICQSALTFKNTTKRKTLKFHSVRFLNTVTSRILNTLISRVLRNSVSRSSTKEMKLKWFLSILCYTINVFLIRTPVQIRFLSRILSAWRTWAWWTPKHSTCPLTPSVRSFLSNLKSRPNLWEKSPSTCPPLLDSNFGRILECIIKKKTIINELVLVIEIQ